MATRGSLSAVPESNSKIRARWPLTVLHAASHDVPQTLLLTQPEKHLMTSLTTRPMIYDEVAATFGIARTSARQLVQRR
jgi:hypothetical protein